MIPFKVGETFNLIKTESGRTVKYRGTISFDLTVTSSKFTSPRIY
jgi:hypothetical protein